MFTPIHLNAAPSDFLGNAGRGRFLLLPGSSDRARRIASAFKDRRTLAHPRGHDLHLGVIERQGVELDVGVISTGMGCPSVDLIVTELIALGARVMLRVGTSGSLQPDVHTGDVVVATCAVRDEATSDHYLPREFPAVASWPLLLATQAAVRSSGCKGGVHFGPVHTKDSLYAREFGFGPRAAEHAQYTRWLAQAGVMATEMECAHLFVLAQLGPLAEGKQRVMAGGVLAVIGEHDQPFTDSPRAAEAVEDAIELAFGTFVELVR
jgi:uridine phosphorylase